MSSRAMEDDVGLWISMNSPVVGVTQISDSRGIPCEKAIVVTISAAIADFRIFVLPFLRVIPNMFFRDGKGQI